MGGAFVRISHSGDGCGNHWPLCYGEFIPQEAHTATWIEFMHRATSGIGFLLVIGLLIWALRAFPRGHHVRYGAGFTMGFMLVEVLVGAALVLLGLVADNVSVERAIVMTAHQANTFLLLAALTLTAWWASGGAPLRLRGQGATLWWLGFALLGGLSLGMTGAVTALADTLFPAPLLREGIIQDSDPNSHFLIQLRILHPIMAFVVGAVLYGAIRRVRRHHPSPAAETLGSVLFMVYIVQIVLGTLNIVLSPLWSRLTHLLLADTIWIALILLAANALAQPVESAAADTTDLPLAAPRTGGQPVG